MFADEFLPSRDVVDSVGVVADAGAATTRAARMSVDHADVGRHEPPVGIHAAIGMLPERPGGPGRWTLGAGPGAQVLVRGAVAGAREIAVEAARRLDRIDAGTDRDTVA